MRTHSRTCHPDTRRPTSTGILAVYRYPIVAPRPLREATNSSCKNDPRQQAHPPLSLHQLRLHHTVPSRGHHRIPALRPSRPHNGTHKGIPGTIRSYDQSKQHLHDCPIHPHVSTNPQGPYHILIVLFVFVSGFSSSLVAKGVPAPVLLTVDMMHS